MGPVLLAALWLAAGVGLAVAEAFSLDFVLIMFAAGAFAAAGAAAFDLPFGVQALVFAGTSVLSLLVVRPMLKRHLVRGGAPLRVGVAALEGAEALVLEQVNLDQGAVKIEGEVWTARPYDATQVFEPGERVKIVEIRGATALVWRNVP